LVDMVVKADSSVFATSKKARSHFSGAIYNILSLIVNRNKFSR
jgi:hypothetical protein